MALPVESQLSLSSLIIWAPLGNPKVVQQVPEGATDDLESCPMTTVALSRAFNPRTALLVSVLKSLCMKRSIC